MSIEEREERIEFHYRRANSLLDEDRARDALAHVEEALAIDPDHLQCLILAGEICTIWAEELGLVQEAASRTSLKHLNRALDHEPRLAEAWGAKAMAHLLGGQFEAALAAAERGLEVLPERVGEPLQVPSIVENVEQTLLRAKVESFRGLGEVAKAREVLREALERYPSCEYLMDLITSDLLPSLPAPTPEQGP